LALWQSAWVKGQLQSRLPGLTIDLRIIKTKGDKILDSPLSTIGDQGLFTREIERALLAGEIDLAIHSLKDLPTGIPNGLAIGAIPARSDVRDVFISKRYGSLEELPTGAIIATGSLRRKAQLLHYRPDLRIVDVRGNLETRLKKLDGSNWDGMILARAGIERLGLSERIRQVIPTEIILPAVGQGALAVEIREDDSDLQRIVRAVHDDDTAACALAERSFLKFLEGGCQVPIAAYARIESDRLELEGMIATLNGKRLLRDRLGAEKSKAEEVGIRLGRRLYESGGEEILRGLREKAGRGSVEV